MPGHQAVQTLKIKPPAPCGAPLSRADTRRPPCLSGESWHASEASSTAEACGQRLQRCPLRSSPCFSRPTSPLSRLPPVLWPVIFKLLRFVTQALQPAVLVQALGSPEDGAWWHGAVRWIWCCRQKEHLSNYSSRSEGMRSLVFNALIYKGLMVVTTIILGWHTKSSLLMKATQWRQSFCFLKCCITGNKSGSMQKTDFHDCIKSSLVGCC